jgi:hypothetical protein
MEDMYNAGVGAVEITPIYGINGAENRHIDYLSPRWMRLYQHVLDEGKRLGITIEMNNGTGWPFGGPSVAAEDAAGKVIFRKFLVQGGTHFEQKIVTEPPRRGLPAQMPATAGSGAYPEESNNVTIAAVVAYSQGQKIDLTDKVTADRTLAWDAPEGEWTIWAAFNGKTLQKVKRAAPGGEGLVMNHYSADALKRYLSRFDEAFTAAGAPWPNTFFNDSYEVYGANWSENLLTEFEKRRGYRLQDYIPELNREGDAETCARIVSDYRETLSELLLDNFTVPWTEWAHSHGVTVRNQAHGSPGNLIDFYATVDIPECESFGRTLFDIPGLRVDSGMKESDSHPFVLKYASSAAHITGKPFVSSETFTWLTEHFRTSLSQMKPELDLLYASGVNHMYYHGSPYSPKDAAWPGWMFYASVNMNANNTIFRDVIGLNSYVKRTQSFLQYGTPDNDFLLYIPIYDIWQEQPGLYLMFDIHKMRHVMPAFFQMVVNIQKLGFETDYISDKYLLQTTVKNGLLQTPGAAYKAIIVPNVHYMPTETMAQLVKLAQDGATIIFADHIPADVPGLKDLETRRAKLKEMAKAIPVEETFPAAVSKPLGKGKIIYGNDYPELLQVTGVQPEELPVKYGASFIRRQNETGHHYFISMLGNHRIADWVKLSVDATSAMIYNPLTEESGKAAVRTSNGQTEVYLELEPGQSVILKTFHSQQVSAPDYAYYDKAASKAVTGEWKFRFTDGMPAIDGEYTMNGSPVSWTEVAHDSATVYAGTGRYSVTFNLNEQADEWLLDLGKLCESARVYVNGQDAGIVWSLPFTLKIGKYLQQGENKLEIDVTNLPANRIRDYDKRGVKWRIFKDINIVSVFYKDINFGIWGVSPSGLTDEVTLTPLTAKTIY